MATIASGSTCCGLVIEFRVAFELAKVGIHYRTLSESSNPTQPSSKIWEWIGQLGLLFGLIWVITQIWKAYSEPKDRLEATLEVNDFAYPPQFYKFGKSVQTTLSSESLLTLLNENKQLLDSKPAIKESAPEIVRAFRELESRFTSDFERLTGLTSPEKVLQVIVQNNGETTLAGVRLSIPYLSEAKFERNGQEFVTETGSAIEIGEMRSGDTIAVNAWTRMPPFVQRDTRLTHAQGTGKVRWIQPIPTDSWSYTFYRLTVFEMFFLSLPFCCPCCWFRRLSFSASPESLALARP